MLTLMLLALCLGRLTANGRAGRRAGRFGPLPLPELRRAKKFAVIKLKV